MDQENSFSSVIKNRGFLNLWINQILVQLAYNSLNFALIIWVFRLTDSNTAVSALLFIVYLPAVLFGIFAGVLVDITDRKKIILLINILLALCFISLVFLKSNYLAILLVTFFVNTLAQFYSPAESSAIPILVKKEQLLAANSLFSTTLFVAFLLGFGLAGPLITHFGINFVFIFESILLLIAYFLATRFPPIINKSDKQGKELAKALLETNYQKIKHTVVLEIKDTFRLITKRLPLMAAMFIMAGVQVVIGIIAVLVPSFLERVLQIDAADASYVLILPLGLGMVIGGLVIGKIGWKFARRRIVGGAITFAGLLFFLVGTSPVISPIIKYFPYSRPLPFFYQMSHSMVLFIGSFLLGIALVSIIIPSQTVLQENTPEEDRGKVFAVLAAVMAGMSLIPVLVVGGLADIFGTLPISLALGLIIALIGAFSLKPNLFFKENHLPPHIREFLGLGHWK